MRRGFPRPRDTTFGLPVPFTAMGLNMIGSGDDDRIADCVVHGLCTVCGLELEEHCCVAVSRDGQYRDNVSKYDPGLCHPKCAVMTVSFCPHFREGRSSMELVDTESILRLLRSMPSGEYRLPEGSLKKIERGLDIGMNLASAS